MAQNSVNGDAKSDDATKDRLMSSASNGDAAGVKKPKSATPEEKRLVKNVVSSLASSLQELSGNFRKSQSTYLKSKQQNG